MILPNEKNYLGKGIVRSGIKIDDLDKKIILHLSNGVASYSILAENCGVGRNTIHRRINRLVTAGLIDKKVRAIPNFTNLNLSAITVLLDITQSEVDRVIKILKNQSRVKFLWRTFGAYNITVVIICDKGEEGVCISKLRTVLEKMRVKTNKFETTISYSWDKIDFSPF
jgi:DNA-binding Lrp family transcriptional regulator